MKEWGKRGTYMAKRGTGTVSRIQRHEYDDVDWRKLAAAVKARDGNKCRICRSTKQLQVHHILPLSRGGTNSQLNLITLCHACHEKRHKHMR